MLTKLWERLKLLEDHHQVVFAIIVIFGIVCISWGLEKIFEQFIFTKKRIFDYILIIIIGLFSLYMTRHIVLYFI